MNEQNHPITPPPNLTSKWNNLPLSNQEILVIAARWGADQELEAMCKLLLEMDLAADGDIEVLRAARRPKASSLKELALELVRRIEGTGSPWELSELSVIRRALEQLDDN